MFFNLASVAVLLALAPATLTQKVEIVLKNLSPKGLLLKASGGTVDVSQHPDKLYFTLDQLKEAVKKLKGKAPDKVEIYSEPYFWNRMLLKVDFKSSRVINYTVETPRKISGELELSETIDAEQITTVLLNERLSGVTYRLPISDKLSATCGGVNKTTIPIRVDVDCDAVPFPSSSYVMKTYEPDMCVGNYALEVSQDTPTLSARVVREPGQTIVAYVVSRKVYIEVEARFATSLTGSVYCYYTEPLEGINELIYDVNVLLDAANVARHVTSTFNFRRTLFLNADIEMRDKDTNKLVPKYEPKPHTYYNTYDDYDYSGVAGRQFSGFVMLINFLRAVLEL